MITSKLEISNEQKEQFQEEGYFILEHALSEAQLEMLREECSIAIDAIDAEMVKQGVDVLGICRRGNRYFITQPSLQRPALREVLQSEVMADICRATLGETANVAWEQFVVKAAETGVKFGWHQDSAYAYAQGVTQISAGVSCWCALDDMSEANGTVYILPYSRGGHGQLVEHKKDEELNDLVGYLGDDPGIPVIVPAGGIAVFSGLAFHRSGSNNTDHKRRVYLAQYSASQARFADGRGFGRAELFLKDGKRV